MYSLKPNRDINGKGFRVLKYIKKIPDDGVGAFPLLQPHPVLAANRHKFTVFALSGGINCAMRSREKKTVFHT